MNSENEHSSLIGAQVNLVVPATRRRITGTEWAKRLADILQALDINAKLDNAGRGVEYGELEEGDDEVIQGMIELMDARFKH